ncbi:tRNA pseudouridine synthase B [Mycobacteroides abscessus]|nr:tRNA pseudouridine synthase B [Mycobacteroides abscessus]
MGGHLTALRRTRVGDFGLDRARALEALADEATLSVDLDTACREGFPRRDLDAAEVDAVRNGRPLSAAGIDGTYAAVDTDDRVIALLADKGSRTTSVVVLRPANL